MPVQRLLLHVEDDIGVEVLAVDACLEVQMLGRGASGASGQCDGLSGFDCVATMYKVFEVVAVYRFQSEVMAYDDDIAVGAIRLGHPYYAVEGTPYGVFGVGLDVYATVASPPPSVRGDDFSSRQGKGVFRVRNVLQR